ncbi:hypothetical protein FA743_18030 [Paracoccus gahaiensis]|uniref:Uncharacterized protein n=1 Tax=Paracoccus gahaiensis TaxID=1706839 RepID=A0A4U0R4L2_9RHOB|nr:hypothetical protein [Paracoccus gahaiensis]TJZ89707.1 hypothetical protein FA743_18030 [Paracoccus gahaiensis]
MKHPAFRARNWIFSAIVSALPSTGLADGVNVIICAHPEGLPAWTMNADVRVLRSGAAIAITPQALENSCVRVDLPACDAAITIEVNVPRSYSGKSTCSTDPTPMLIAMQANRVEILTAAFADVLGDGLPSFNRQSFLAEIARTEAVLPELPAEGRRAVDALYAAIATGNYPEVQRQAAEAAGFLRSVEEERLSLAYSSITYVAGFRAIGLDPLASENPLVTAGPTPSSVVLNEEGRNVLELYQSARAIPAAPGIWDFATTASVANVTPLAMEETLRQDSIDARGAIAPQVMGVNDFSIDATGRMVLQ